MKPFRRFYFDKFNFDEKTLTATFSYNFDDAIFFEEKVCFKNKGFKLRKKLNKDIIHNFLLNIHLAIWISYYKLYPTKELIIKSWYLDSEAIIFWNKFYKNGLSEFLYTNKISPKKLFNFMNISRDSYLDISKLKDFEVEDKAMIPLWWWKDSIVTIELLKKWNIKMDTIVFWKMDKVKENVLQKSWLKNLLIKRDISEELFKLNKQWYYNWHIPITWIIAFNLLFMSYLYNYKYIILSNEKSADIPNTIWKGLEINHQYSKSLEFEEDLSLYTEKYLSDNIKYFSILKWMYEYKISKLFVWLWEKYFKVFSSCNNNFKIKEKAKDNLWCNSCPKCVFVYVMLSAFLDKDKLIDIFWEDLYDREDLKWLFDELLWISWLKPFECVWDKKEMILAMKKSIKLYKSSKIKLPYILKLYKKDIIDNLDKKELKEIKKELNQNLETSNIPTEINKLVNKI